SPIRIPNPTCQDMDGRRPPAERAAREPDPAREQGAGPRPRRRSRGRSRLSHQSRFGPLPLAAAAVALRPSFATEQLETEWPGAAVGWDTRSANVLVKVPCAIVAGWLAGHGP